ncbi:hypothetical protein HMPREF1977_1941 [Capnocytophaga ochracea F0287]|uniref:Uncharacterized protein n=1 Tax=Capnocytophaga ochracea F0287 TaxID=873517 RepID=E4MU81_CAPOC|nr:hypothetical protein HMPREF1977_1941 [Capnocytophaga ochracea F0287]
MPIILKMPKKTDNQLCQSFKLWQSGYRKSDVLGLLGGFQKISKKFGRRLKGFLVKKGCKEGRVSL